MIQASGKSDESRNVTNLNCHALEPECRRSLDWRKSTRSVGDGECVEIAAAHRRIVVRDSRSPNGAVLVCDEAEWFLFISRIKRISV